MFSDIYREYMQSIEPDDELVAAVKKRMRGYSAARPVQRRRVALAVCAAAAALALILIPTLSSRTAPKIAVVTPASPSDGGKLPDIALTGDGRVLYSSIPLAQAETVDIPAEFLRSTASMCLVAPTQEVLTDCDFGVKATVTAVRFVEYDRQTEGKNPGDVIHYKERWVQYTLNIDRMLTEYSGLAAGGELVVEECMYDCTSLCGSVIPLQKGRQYLLPIVDAAARHPDYCISENPYRLSYSYVPQIEVDQRGGYLFFADPDNVSEWSLGWVSLLTDQTLDVEPDTGESYSFSDCLRYRSDAAFEDELAELLG